jgi:hypothetical protein
MRNLPFSPWIAIPRLRGVAFLGFPLLMVAGSAWHSPARAACPQQVPGVAMGSDRQASLRTQGQLPDACLKLLVRQCDAQAEAGFLDGGSAAQCSVRYEALLHQGFRGDFHSFLRWWQSSPKIASH